MADDDYQLCMVAQLSEHVRRQIPSHAVMHGGGRGDPSLLSPFSLYSVQ
jgi:hypothetical protein